jgi:hypothetical protein
MAGSKAKAWTFGLILAVLTLKSIPHAASSLDVPRPCSVKLTLPQKFDASYLPRAACARNPEPTPGEPAPAQSQDLLPRWLAITLMIPGALIYLTLAAYGLIYLALIPLRRDPAFNNQRNR